MMKKTPLLLLALLTTAAFAAQANAVPVYYGGRRVNEVKAISSKASKGNTAVAPGRGGHRVNVSSTQTRSTATQTRGENGNEDSAAQTGQGAGSVGSGAKNPNKI